MKPTTYQVVIEWSPEDYKNYHKVAINFNCWNHAHCTYMHDKGTFCKEELLVLFCDGTKLPGTCTDIEAASKAH